MGNKRCFSMLVLLLIFIISASAFAETDSGGDVQGGVGEPAVNKPAVVDDPIGAANQYLDELNNNWKTIAEEYAPEIRVLDNGVMVQRTPSEYSITGWMWQSDTISYNTYWLDADNRGCQACHANLDDLIMNMNYDHPAFWNKNMGVNTTVQQCLICHTLADGYITSNYDFGTLIHAIHYAKDSKYSGNCMSCHNMTADGNGVALWDLVKYKKMVGIENVADVEGEFSFTQDKTQSMSEVFSYDWMHSDADNMRHALGVNGANVQPPQDMFDNWEITIDGLVENPYTIKLPELIAKAEEAGVVKTKISKMTCDWCAVGGGGITNVEITGIPLRWLLEEAGGWDESATGVIFKNIDGDEGSLRCVRIDRIDDVYLVYKIGGEYLDGSRGYPVTNWYEAVDAQSNKKQILGYTVTADLEWDYYDTRIPNGWKNAEGGYDNKPNATILKNPEGLIIETGVPHTFEGYADAYDEKIVSLEFSMDQGETWTKYDLGDTDVTKWVYWYFTWTPQTDASYVLTVRATTESGLVSSTLHSVMVTARSDMEDLQNEN